MKEKKISQLELSLQTEIPQGSISDIANDKKPRIHLRTAAKISLALGETVEYIFPDYFKGN